MPKISDDTIYGRAALKEWEPWIVPESLDLLNTLVKPGMKVFEWGSGGSTLYWAKHGCQTISIEHNWRWLKWVSAQLIKGSFEATVLYVPKDEDKDTFHNYADAIKVYDKFDIIFVDGEASCRGWCLRHAFEHLTEDGYIVLDNSNWLKTDFPGWKRQDFIAKGLEWIGQKGTFDWWTSIFHKE